jgi:toxin ParE1/3/4
MAREVTWTHSAEADLEVVIEYIHRDFPAYAAAFMLRALEAGRSLGELAERGRMVPELRDENTREIFVESYRVIYRIESDQVSILALIHGRREFIAAWDEKNR